MATHTLTLDTKEMVKLLDICNTALAAENTTLRHLPTDSNASKNCAKSIAATEIIKTTIKKALWNSLGDG